MPEVRYKVEESYPGGHEIRYKEYGPATEAEIREGKALECGPYVDGEPLEIHGDGFLNPDEMLDMLFRDGELNVGDGTVYRLHPHREYALVYIRSQGSVHGPYTYLEAETKQEELGSAYRIVQLQP